MGIECCGSTFELASGEVAGPCHLPKGHDGETCEGWLLGSIATWQRGVASEYEQWLNSQQGKTMKYSTEGQIKMIASLQEEAKQCELRAKEALKEADALTEELKDEVGADQFVFRDQSFKFDYAARGFGIPCNRYWLRENRAVKVLA